MNGKRMYEFLEKISFTRTGGTKEELQVANIIKDEIESVGGSATIVPFEVNLFDIAKVSLKATNNTTSKNYNVSAYGWCGEEVKLKAPFYYFEGIDEVSKKEVCGKIALVNGYVGYDLYKVLIESKAIGFISFSGEIRDSDDITDLDQRELRTQLASLGVIPGVHMTVHDALDLVEFNPEFVEIEIKQTHLKGNSHNVISEIEGTDCKDEVIVFTAHYDSVYYSTGVYDNGAGSAIHLELYRYFKENPPKRTVRFIWCGSEERGLLGSKAYAYGLEKEELEKIVLCVNTDVAGPVLGRDSVCVIGDMEAVNMISSFTKEIGFSANVRQSIYSSDCIPFADLGIPAINFMRFGVPGTAYIHNRHDTLLFMSASSLEKTANFVKALCDRIISSYIMPINRSIPQNMVEEVNKYLKKQTKKVNN